MGNASESMTEYFAKYKYMNEVAANYDDVRRNQQKWLIENAVVARFISSSNPGQKVLDVPFGTGRFVDLYLAKGLEVHGADISPDMLAEAAKVLGDKAEKCQLIVSDALDLPYEDGAFDFIVCNRFVKWLPTVEHVDRLLNEFSRVCRGAILVQWNIRREKGWISQALGSFSGQSKVVLAKLKEENIKTKYTEKVMMRSCCDNNLEILEYFPLPEIRSSIRYFVLTPR